MCLELNVLCIYLLTVLEIICSQFAKSEIVSSPLNAAAVSGKPVDMNCSVNPDSHTIVYCSWEFSRPRSIEEITIYTPALGINKSVSSFEMRHQSNSSCDLAAKKVQLRDAGLYICNIRIKNTINGSMTFMRHSAHLVVLESNPQCSRSREVVKRWCSVTYRGNWSPVVEWRRNDGQTIPGAISYDTNGSISNRLDDKGDTAHICVIHFSNYSGNISMTAGNTPSYNSTCPNLPDASTTCTHNPGSASEKISTEGITAGLMSCVPVVLTGVLIWVSVLRCKKNRMEKSKKPSVLPVSVEPFAPVIPVAPAAPVVPLQSRAPVSSMVGLRVASRTQPVHIAPEQIHLGAPSPLPAAQNPMPQNGDSQCLGAHGTSPNLNGDSINPEQRGATVRPPLYERVEYASIDHTVLLLPPPLPPR